MSDAASLQAFPILDPATDEPFLIGTIHYLKDPRKPALFAAHEYAHDLDHAMACAHAGSKQDRGTVLVLRCPDTESEKIEVLNVTWRKGRAAYQGADHTLIYERLHRIVAARGLRIDTSSCAEG